MSRAKLGLGSRLTPALTLSSSRRLISRRASSAFCYNSQSPNQTIYYSFKLKNKSIVQQNIQQKFELHVYQTRGTQRNTESLVTMRLPIQLRWANVEGLLRDKGLAYPSSPASTDIQ